VRDHGFMNAIRIPAVASHM